MHFVRAIIQLLDRGCSYRTIAAQLNISRITVTKYARTCKQSKHSFQDLLSMDDATLMEVVYPKQPDEKDPIDQRLLQIRQQTEYWVKELKRTGVTKLLLWREYIKKHPDGYRYSQFCKLLATYQKVNNPVMHFEYKPADRLMVDFAGDKMYYTDRVTNERIGCPVLVCVLPFSGYSFAMALPDATLPQVVRALNRCLAFFGGVPQTFKSDNMRQLVTRNCKYEPTFTDMIEQWSLHNNIALFATRVRKPQDKAPVENEVKLTYQRLYAPLRDEEFYSVDEINAAFVRQLAVHHQQPFQKMQGNRITLFEEQEKPFLQPLPQTTYAIKHLAIAKVQKDYHVILGENHHHYSVPFNFIGKEVKIVYDTEIVEVYCQNMRIALHTRNYKKGGWTTLRDHMPASHQTIYEHRSLNKDAFLEKASGIGPNTRIFVERVFERKHAEQNFNTCLGLLRLAKVYSKERVEAACERALQTNTCSYKMVSTILDNKTDMESATEAAFKLPPHQNLRGSQAYE